MSTASPPQAQAGGSIPPYPAAITIPSPGWHSPLARDGRVPLALPTIQIGRMESNEIILTDPLVSRHHAAIRWTPSGYELEDLGAANGTYVDGVRITGRVALAPGQTIRIGNTDLLFNVLAAGAQAPISPRYPASTGGAQGASGNAASPSPSPVPTQVGYPPIWPQAPQLGRTAAAPYQQQYPYPYYGMMAPRRENRFAHWFKSHLSKRYWQVFLIGLGAYIISAIVLATTQNLNFVPLVLLLASALVPVVFVIFCWEQSAFVDMPPAVVGVTFMSGAIFGLIIAGILEPIFIPPSLAQHGIDLAVAILVGIIEESAKVISVLWFLRDKRLRSELDGLILGAAAGMGFAALETAGYGFTAFLSGFIRAASVTGADQRFVIATAVTTMNTQLVLRMALAVFGHGVWTSIVCATIWRERGQPASRATLNVLIAFAIAVCLHALWDWSPIVQLLSGSTRGIVALFIIVCWYLFIGGLGILFLRFLLRESLRRAKLGSLAPAPPPLLLAFFRETFGVQSGPQTASALSYTGAAPAALAYQPQPQAQPGQQPLRPAPYQSPASPQSAQQPGPQSAGSPQQAPAQPLWPATQPAAVNAKGPLTCPRCNIQYPAGAQRCARCGGPLIPTLPRAR